MRDPGSGWRVYDEAAVLAVEVTAYLRSFDISIKEVRAVLEDMSLETMNQVIVRHIQLISGYKQEWASRELAVTRLLQHTSVLSEKALTTELLYQLKNTVVPQSRGQKKEKNNVEAIAPVHVRFITLPPMRLAYHIAVSASPEEEAIAPVTAWLTHAGLLGTARLLGGNMPPFPGKDTKVYGYGMCASVPENAEIPAPFKEMRFAGGLYAMMESSEDIYGSWQKLMKHLKKHPEYVSDHKSRLCFEEHIRSDHAEGSGNPYVLNLLEPVRTRG